MKWLRYYSLLLPQALSLLCYYLQCDLLRLSQTDKCLNDVGLQPAHYRPTLS